MAIAHSRTWSQRVTAYLSVILVGPVMVFTALTLNSFGSKFLVVERLFEIGFVSYLFTLTTSVMPVLSCFAAIHIPLQVHTLYQGTAQFCVSRRSRRRRLMAACRDGICRVRSHSARYAAVYSSFAIVIVFLIWLYTGWLIFLIGAEVAYFHQYPSAFLYEAMTDGKGYRFQEWLALSTLLRSRVATSRTDLPGSKRNLPPFGGFEFRKSHCWKS